MILLSPTALARAAGFYVVETANDSEVVASGHILYVGPQAKGDAVLALALTRLRARVGGHGCACCVDDGSPKGAPLH